MPRPSTSRPSTSSLLVVTLLVAGAARADDEPSSSAPVAPAADDGPSAAEPGPGAAGLDDEQLPAAADDDAVDDGVDDWRAALPDPDDLTFAELFQTAPTLSVVHVGGKGTRFAVFDGLFSLSTEGRLQVRVTAEPTLDDVVSSRLEQPTKLDLTRARLRLNFGVLDDRLQLRFMLDPEIGVPAILDANIFAVGISPWLAVQVGQGRTYYSRQFSTSARDSQLVDRAPTDDIFDPRRDVGVLLQSGNTRTPFVFTAGVFTGQGHVIDARFQEQAQALWSTWEPAPVDMGQAIPLASKPLFVARLMGGYGHSDPYVESDLDGGGLRVSLGAGVLGRADVESLTLDETGVTLDGLVKWEGLAVSGAVFSSTRRGDGPLAVDLSAVGGYLQAGYVVNSFLEPAARYAIVSGGADGVLQQEAVLGLNLWAFASHLKFQIDTGFVHDADTMSFELGDMSARTRLQAEVRF